MAAGGTPPAPPATRYRLNPTQRSPSQGRGQLYQPTQNTLRRHIHHANTSVKSKILCVVSNNNQIQYILYIFYNCMQRFYILRHLIFITYTEHGLILDLVIYLKCDIIKPLGGDKMQNGQCETCKLFVRHFIRWPITEFREATCGHCTHGIRIKTKKPRSKACEFWCKAENDFWQKT